VSSLAAAASPSAFVCGDADHYSSTHGDRGWGCGYRNLQLLLSALARRDRYAAALRSAGLLPNAGHQYAVPSLPRLQELIEAAWEAGFDTDGRDQVRKRLTGDSHNEMTLSAGRATAWH